MNVQICDVCAEPIRVGTTSGVFPTYKKDGIYPGRLETCEDCSIKISGMIEGLINLPDKVVLSLIDEEQEVESEE